MSTVETITNELTSFKEGFIKLKKGLRFSRLGKPFTTSKSKYFFDSGTGKVFKVNNNVYEILNCLWETDKFDELFKLDISMDNLIASLNEISEIIEKEHILQMPAKLNMLYNTTSCEECENKNDEIRLFNFSKLKLKHICFEMTEACNLRCKYCIYHEEGCGFRNFGKRSISFEIIKKAIDMITPSEKEIAISFYGGEPLIEFDLIKQTINYCNKKFYDKNLSFNMTTNATLITEEIANYIASIENFYVTVSLDGPEHIHNKNRVFIDGSGSFNKAIEGLKKLVKAEGDNASKNIRFNAVLDSSLNEKMHDEIQQFFDTYKYIPKDAEVSTSFVTTKSKESKYIDIGTEEDIKFKNSFKNRVDPLLKWNINKFGIEPTVSKGPSLIKYSFYKNLYHIHNRMLVNNPINFMTMNGCCIPGNRKIYVTVDGNFSPCERIGPSPFIGNVNDGLDFNAINKYYEKDFVDNASKYCNKCWAVHLCSLCYANFYDKDGFNIEKRHFDCRINRLSLEEDLQMYHELLENNPESLKFLDNLSYS